MFTKDDARKLLALWESSTLEEICKELDLKKTQVLYLASQMKKAGIALSTKRAKGSLLSMLKELKKELEN